MLFPVTPSDVAEPEYTLLAEPNVGEVSSSRSYPVAPVTADQLTV